MQNPYSMFGEDYEVFADALPSHQRRAFPPVQLPPLKQPTDVDVEEAWACQRFPLLEARDRELRRLGKSMRYREEAEAGLALDSPSYCLEDECEMPPLNQMTDSEVAYQMTPQERYMCQTCFCGFSRPSLPQIHSNIHTGNSELASIGIFRHTPGASEATEASMDAGKTTEDTVTALSNATALPYRGNVEVGTESPKEALERHNLELTRLAKVMADKRISETPSRQGSDKAEAGFIEHSSGQRVFTEAIIIKALREQYPGSLITTVPVRSCSLLAYAAAGHASFSPISTTDKSDSTHKASGTVPGMNQHIYVPPLRRLHGEAGAVLEQVTFGRYKYEWERSEFIVYFVEGGDMFRGVIPLQYVIGGTREEVDALILEAGSWANELHGEVWVFDKGYWHKDKETWNSVKKAKWDDVILEDAKKKAIQDDVLRFFRAEERYKGLGVPWKRGVIYFGPPGNGKTISIKAVLNQMSSMERPVSITSLYVRSLASYAGPEYATSLIFTHARRSAPCILIFEDLDSLVTPAVRSYFLNEIDGLQANDGIFMIGSTNHLDKLDPAFKSRPSRFDRKFEFKDPDEGERVLYCKFWRGKILKNGDGGGGNKGAVEVEFPEALCKRIAGITDGFSFAYLQEAFVGALLAIAAEDDGDDDDDDDGNGAEVGNGNENADEDEFELVGEAVQEQRDEAGGGDGEGGDDNDIEKLVLWKAIQKQVEILRKEL